MLDEIGLDVQKGYGLVDIHEDCEYQVTQYDAQTGECGVLPIY